MEFTKMESSLILSLIYKLRITTKKQLSLLTGKKITTINKQIDRLFAKKLLNRITYFREYYYYLSSISSRLLNVNHKPNPKVNISNMHHQNIVCLWINQNLANIQEFKLETELLSENGFHQKDKKVPDILFLDTNNQWIAVEIELTKKSKARYETQFMHIKSDLMHEVYSKIIYVVPNEDMKRYLLKNAFCNITSHPDQYEIQIIKNII